MFYYNPADPRVWLPKASGLGWTLNFAHPLSWVLLIGTLLLAFGISYLRKGGLSGGRSKK